MDKFYTKTPILDKSSGLILEVIEKCKEEVCFIDFSCGNNYLCNILSKQGVKCFSYDIDPPKNMDADNVITCDWLTVKPHNIGNCVIGINPPFGKNGTEARKFVDHALLFKPLFIVLILPKIRWKIHGYTLMHSEQLDVNSFYIPDGKDFSWPTTLLLLSRNVDSGLRTFIAKSKKNAKLDVDITRKWKNGFTGNMAIIRRAGRNAGHQSYVVSGDSIIYRSNGQWKVTEWTQNKHSVEGDCFLKIYPTDKPFESDYLIGLCEKIDADSDCNKASACVGYITNKFVADRL